MSERPPSVLFGVALPAPGTFTAGQRWTAAVAVGLAALLLASGGGTALLGQAPTAGAGPLPPVAERAEQPAADAGGSVAPSAEPVPPLEAAPSPAPTQEPAVDPGSTDPAPAPPPEGGEEEGSPPACATPAAPVLAGAGLCPPGEREN